MYVDCCLCGFLSSLCKERYYRETKRGQRIQMYVVAVLPATMHGLKKTSIGWLFLTATNDYYPRNNARKLDIVVMHMAIARATESRQHRVKPTVCPAGIQQKCEQAKASFIFNKKNCACSSQHLVTYLRILDTGSSRQQTINYTLFLQEGRQHKRDRFSLISFPGCSSACIHERTLVLILSYHCRE